MFKKNTKITFIGVFTFLASFDSVISLIIRVINLFKKDNKNNTMDYHVLIQVFSIAATFGICFYFINKIDFLYKKLRIMTIINQVRDHEYFHQRFNGLTFYRLPDESMEEYYKRSPDGEYEKRFLNEIIEVRNKAREKLSDLTTNEVDNIISDCYELTP